MEKMKSVYLDPFTDFGFKYLFGREQSASLLIDLLNTLLKLEKKIIESMYINTEQLGLGDFDRKAVFDIHCKDEDGNIFIIELQKLREVYFKARSLFYSTFPIKSQAKKGDWDFNLKKIYTICLMDFKFDDTHPDQLIHEIKLINTQTKEVFNDLLTFLYVEIVKFNKQEHELVTREDQWLFVLHNLNRLKEIPLSLAEDSIFNQFFMDAEEASLKEAELWAYYASKKAKWDAYAQLETAKIEGKVEGAMNSKIEMARLMKLDNEPFEKITKYTGLSVAEIKSI